MTLTSSQKKNAQRARRRSALRVSEENNEVLRTFEKIAAMAIITYYVKHMRSSEAVRSSLESCPKMRAMFDMRSIYIVKCDSHQLWKRRIEMIDSFLGWSESAMEADKNATCPSIQWLRAYVHHEHIKGQGGVMYVKNQECIYLLPDEWKDSFPSKFCDRLEDDVVVESNFLVFVVETQNKLVVQRITRQDAVQFLSLDEHEHEQQA